jgi:hypothetical protein
MRSKTFMKSAAGDRLPSGVGGRLAWQLPVALLAASAPTLAQPAESGCAALPPGQARELHSGMCVRSTIGPDDQKVDDIPYEDWRLPLAMGETVQIDMDAIAPQPPAAADAAPAQAATEARAFDTYLELRREGVAEPLESNDDRPGSLNSRIVFTASAAGNYIVRARPLYGEGGDYTLRVGTPPPPPPVVPLVAGRNQVPAAGASGGLQPRLFSFEGRAGERVRLALERKMWGDQLHLIAPDGTALGQAGEFSQTLTLVAILPQTGTYQVQAQMQGGPGGQAASVLDFARRTAVPARAPRPIRLDETVTGDLGLESAVGSDPYGGPTPAFSELYELSARAGQVITVTLESSAFDPVIDAGLVSPLGFASALTDDDGGGGRNSRLVLRPDRAGPITLRVRALGNGFGAFRLSVRPGDVPAQPPQPDPPTPQG